MLTGRKPFEADTSYSVLNAQLNEAPTPPIQVNPELPPALNNIVMRAMEKQPDMRFQTADEFRNALKALREPQAAQQAPQPVAQAQGFAPVNLPASALAPSAGKSHRALWIGLGALAAVLALVAAATVLPRIFATHANQKIAATDAQPQAIAPAAGSATQPSPAASEATPQPDPLSAAAANTAPPASGTAASQPSSTAGAQARPPYVRPRPAAASGAQPQAAGPAASASSAPAAPAGPSPQQVRQARDRLMNLDARADAARSGVQQIRSQQQAQGLDIRGDILAAMSRMNNDLGEANRALAQNDLQTANEYMERADREASTLELFLGR